MLEGVESTVSYAPVFGVCSLHVIIVIESAEGLIISILEPLDDIYTPSSYFLKG